MHASAVKWTTTFEATFQCLQVPVEKHGRELCVSMCMCMLKARAFEATFRRLPVPVGVHGREFV
jgi:hypothetical protein